MQQKELTQLLNLKKKKLQTLKKSKKIRNEMQSIINESSFH